MKHNKIISTLAVVAAALCCLAGCEKDKTTQTLQIITPGFENESNQKVYLENTKPIWNADVDQVRINTTQVCTVTYNGTRYEVNPNPANAYYAIFPTSDGNTAGANGGTVVIRATQTYSEYSSGKQNIIAPMAACLNSSNGNLVFHNVCSLLKVIVQNYNTNYPITVNYIKAEGQTTSTKLSGTLAYTFSGNGVSSSPLSAGGTSVTLTGINKQIAKGGSKEFYLIIAPYSSARLDITVNATVNGHTADFVQKQNENKAVSKNQIFTQPFASAFNNVGN